MKWISIPAGEANGRIIDAFQIMDALVTREEWDRSFFRVGREDPMACVNFEEAAAFASRMNARLPTYDEWARAVHFCVASFANNDFWEWTSAPANTNEEFQLRCKKHTTGVSVDAVRIRSYSDDCGFRCVRLPKNYDTGKARDCDTVQVHQRKLRERDIEGGRGISLPTPRVIYGPDMYGDDVCADAPPKGVIKR